MLDVPQLQRLLQGDAGGCQQHRREFDKQARGAAFRRGRPLPSAEAGTEQSATAYRRTQPKAAPHRGQYLLRGARHAASIIWK
ncbi:MAG: hypothetical protein WKG07_23305 [Hymenobacter sp.]